MSPRWTISTDVGPLCVCGLPFALYWERQSGWGRKTLTGWNLHSYLIFFSVEEKEQREVDNLSYTFQLIHAFDPSGDQNQEFNQDMKRSVETWVWLLSNSSKKMQQLQSLQVLAGARLTSKYCLHSPTKNSWPTANASMLIWQLQWAKTHF